jgi:hypothetical protein
MSTRNTAIHLITKVGTLFGGLFLVGVLLAAIPAHKSQPPQTSGAQESQSAPTNGERSAEVNAVHDVGASRHHAHHVPTTPVRDHASSQDTGRRAARQ